MLTKRAMKSKGKNAPVKETARYFVLAGGDQSAESTLGHVKGTQRRFGNIGRMKSTVPTRKNVETLAAAAMLRRAGFDRIMEALRDYRKAGSKRVLKVGLTEAYNTSKRWWAVQKPET